MNLGRLWAEIEDDQAWREEEIRFFQNRAVSVADPNEQDQFRRALVLLLYAHFEGFVKFSLLLYVGAVNSAGVRCDEASYAVAAASLADLFAALRDPTRKCPEFRRDLPDDSALHRFARDR